MRYTIYLKFPFGFNLNPQSQFDTAMKFNFATKSINYFQFSN